MKVVRAYKLVVENVACVTGKQGLESHHVMSGLPHHPEFNGSFGF